MENNRVINPNEYGSLLFDEKEEKAVNNVMKAKRIFRYSKTLQPYTEKFEKILQEKMKVKFCLGVINGTAGLITALRAIDIQPNDRVLVSSYTYIATALAVKLIGAVPIPMEIDMENGLDIEDLNIEIKKGCKAVIVTHLQGRCFDLTKLKNLLKKNKIFLVEDACQGFGSNYKGTYAGTFGDVGVYSFQQFKQISSGEGGAIVTNNKIIYERARNYTDMGAVRDRFPNWDSDSCLFGQNYRINNLSTAILYEQMKKLDYMLSKQQNSRKKIQEKIKRYNINSIVSSKDSEGDTGMNIVLLAKDASKVEEIIRKAKEKYNIEIRKMWKGLYFENKLFKDNNLTDNDLKEYECDKTRNIIERMIVISIPPVLCEKEEKIIASVIIELKKEDYI